MIRFHSFYPWHTGGDYRQLCSEQDLAMLPWVQEFKYSHPTEPGREGGRGVGGLWASPESPSLLRCSKFDLYTKCPHLPDVDQLRPYYQGLIDKYCPGVLSW